MAQQTTVEWLEDNLIGNPHFEEDFRHNMNVFKQAKQMEKEQIMNARLSTFDLIRRDDILKAEQYYNETYGK